MKQAQLVDTFFPEHIFSHDCSSHTEEHVQDWPLLQICLPENSVTCEFLAVSFHPKDKKTFNLEALLTSP